MTGKGRGRGWLHLDKSLLDHQLQQQQQQQQQQPPPPQLGLQQSNQYQTHVHKLTWQQAQDNSKSHHYNKIVNAMDKFNEADDGIQLNYKFQTVVSALNDECQAADELSDIIKHLYNTALQDSNFTPKFIQFVSLNSFRDLTIAKQDARHEFLQLLQLTFKDYLHLAEQSPVQFRNSVRIISGFYERAQMKLGTNYFIVAPAVMQYFLRLLESNDVEDLKLFTMRLYACGPKFCDDAVDLQELDIKIRSMFVSNFKLIEEARVWLLLGLDLCLSRFRLLSSHLLNFYQMKLGSEGLFFVKQPLSVECAETATVPSIAPKVDEYVNQSETETLAKLNGNSALKTGGGRPILGAGARKHNNTTSNSTENNMSSMSQWRKLPEDDTRRSAPRKPKGWEHDDRFDTDY